MNRGAWKLVLGILLAGAPAGVASERAITPDLARIGDGKTWRLVNAEFDASTREGRPAVRLRPKGAPGPGSVVAMALVEGLDFTGGTVDVDLRGNGAARTGFLGIAFGVADARTFEAVYFRPFRFTDADKASRAHAVQYVAWPEHTWENLRREKPGVYESALKPAPDPGGWFHARMEVTKDKVRVYVDGAKEPCLVVDRLAGRAGGGIGLWVDSRESAFANLRIVPTEAR
jgi:hypothetical protein